jgi:hypothetical protein
MPEFKWIEDIIMDNAIWVKSPNGQWWEYKKGNQEIANVFRYSICTEKGETYGWVVLDLNKPSEILLHGDSFSLEEAKSAVLKALEQIHETKEESPVQAV